jgi:hypothetical protein
MFPSDASAGTPFLHRPEFDGTPTSASESPHAVARLAPWPGKSRRDPRQWHTRVVPPPESPPTRRRRGPRALRDPTASRIRALSPSASLTHDVAPAVARRVASTW